MPFTIRVRETDGTIRELPAKQPVAMEHTITMATSVPANSQNVPRDFFIQEKHGRKQRHTLFTLNNYTDEELDTACWYATSKGVRYMCWAKEVGESGTPHLQGYVAWDQPRSLEKFRVDLGGRLHYGDIHGRTNGSAEQNRAYCRGMVEKKGMTPNPTFVEYGELPQQGERSDWKQAVVDLATHDVSDVIYTQPQLLPCIRALERFKQISLRPVNRDVRCIVLIGPSGVGKSRWAYENYPDLYSKPDGQWWDGYTGQTTLLLDDYYGDISYAQFLKVLDRYPLQVPIKGGFTYAQWNTVVITSNKHPDAWYVQGFTDALNRRMEITYIDDITNAVSPQDDPQAPPSRRCTPSSRIPQADDKCA